MRLCVCVSVCLPVSAAWFRLHSICTSTSLCVSFLLPLLPPPSSSSVQCRLHVCPECLMFVNAFLCLRAFQTNTPGGGRHEREPGRRVHHGGPQPQRRPLMVPSIGQYREWGWREGVGCGGGFYLTAPVLQDRSVCCSVKTPMSFSVSPDHHCVVEPCSCPSLPDHKFDLADYQDETS